MLESLLHYDESLFRIINGSWHNDFLDTVLPYWREKKFWYPLYLFLLIYLPIKFKWKGLYLILALAITTGIADTVSSKVLKKSVKRLRPCNDPQIKDDVVLLVGCGRAYSFTSSHAANHFAMGTFLALTFGLYFKRWRWLLYFWAASIAFAQVYVGVHYPLDVIVGGLIGWLIAFVLAKVYFIAPKVSITKPSNNAV